MKISKKGKRKENIGKKNKEEIKEINQKVIKAGKKKEKETEEKE